MGTLTKLWWTLLLGVAACASPEPVETPTQVLVHLVATDPVLAARVTELRVQASRSPEQAPGQVSIDMRARTFPVDVPVLPRNRADRVEKFEVIVEAWGDQRVLAQTRATTSFLVGRHLTLTLELFGCPDRPEGFVCADASCRGPQCTVCNTRGECVPVPDIDPGALPAQPTTLDASSGADSDAAGSDAGAAAAEAAVPPEREGGAPMPQPDAGNEAGAPPTTPDATTACTAGSCGSGYVCSGGGSCISACKQTQCDPNADCVLQDGEPNCSCRTGYVAMRSGSSVVCVRDNACDELACGAGANCEVGGDGLHHCVCKLGFMQTGSGCVAVSCPALTLSNGKVSGERSYGAVADHTCNSGYWLNGVKLRSCMSNGQWSDSAPVCEPVDCGSAPPAPSGGTRTASGTRFGAEANYGCNSGYVISGASRITCLASGLWSGPAPGCTPLCGNGKRDSGETCDPDIAGEAGWCSETSCTWAKVPYGACSSAANCPAGLSCVRGVCTKSCTDPNDAVNCPLPPVPSSAIWCGPASYCEMTNCNGGGGYAPCSPGLACVFDQTWVCRGQGQ